MSLFPRKVEYPFKQPNSTWVRLGGLVSQIQFKRGPLIKDDL